MADDFDLLIRHSGFHFGWSLGQFDSLQRVVLDQASANGMTHHSDKNSHLVDGRVPGGFLTRTAWRRGTPGDVFGQEVGMNMSRRVDLLLEEENFDPTPAVDSGLTTEWVDNFQSKSFFDPIPAVRFLGLFSNYHFADFGLCFKGLGFAGFECGIGSKAGTAESFDPFFVRKFKPPERTSRSLMQGCHGF